MLIFSHRLHETQVFKFCPISSNMHDSSCLMKRDPIFKDSLKKS